MSATVLQGDCREVVRTLPDASVDVVITDPPYGDTSCAWDRQVDGWLTDLPRVLKPSGSLWCFGSFRFFLDRAADFADWTFAQDLIWEKHNGSGLHADRFRRVHELLVQFYPKGRPWAAVYKSPVYSNDATARAVRRKQRPQHWGGIGPGTYVSEDGGPRLLRSVLHCPSEHGKAEHETQKPAALLLPIIEYSCPPGGLILDVFAGSGSTGIAARAVDRRAILIELREETCNRMSARLDRDMPLFAAAT